MERLQLQDRHHRLQLHARANSVAGALVSKRLRRRHTRLLSARSTELTSATTVAATTATTASTTCAALGTTLSFALATATLTSSCAAHGPAAAAASLADQRYLRPARHVARSMPSLCQPTPVLGIRWW